VPAAGGGKGGFGRKTMVGIAPEARDLPDLPARAGAKPPPDSAPDLPAARPAAKVDTDLPARLPLSPDLPARPAPKALELRPIAKRPADLPARPVAKAPEPPKPPEAAKGPEPRLFGKTTSESVMTDFPSVLGGLDEPDLPEISAGKAPVKGPPPARSVPAAAKPVSSAPDLIDELDFDLPAVPSDLPSAKAAAPKPGLAKPPLAKPPGRSGLGSLESRIDAALDVPLEPDLPSPVADLPAARAKAVEASQAAFLSDLPVIAAPDLPVRARVAPDLPVVAASLPSPAKDVSLPVVAPSLPARAASKPGPSLPMPAPSLPVAASAAPKPSSMPAPRGAPAAGGGHAFGEVELPTVGDSFPPATGHAPSGGQKAEDSAFGLFGEIDLPHESPPSAPHKAAASSAPPIDFGDLELDEPRARSNRPASRPSVTPPVSRSDPPNNAGGMSFGEVDIGGPAADESSIGLDAVEHPQQAVEAPMQLDGGPVPVARPPEVKPAEEQPRKRSVGAKIAASVFVLALIGGAALQVTPYGAFGYLVIGDKLHAGDYRRATSTAIADGDKAAAPDTYDAAKKAIDLADAAQSGMPRARSLTAYAAFADLSLSARFGPDAARPSRGAQLLGTLPTDTPIAYRDAAQAAKMIGDGDGSAARTAIGEAAAHAASTDPNDPLLLDLALVAGNLALSAKDVTGAQASFTKAEALANDARAHFGLARTYDVAGDAANLQKEIEATLAASPGHPGALILRARPKSAAVDPTKALDDLSIVIDGPSRAKASPEELSSAYAARAWISLDRGGATDAREAFAQAVAIDPRNLDALNGQGRLFLNEERATEALARFDTALEIDPTSPETIANDAEAKIALERLADAKQQLVAARATFPKSIPILILLGKVEQHLGNSDAADADLRAAIALVDPGRPDAVLPYVALSKLLCERGKLTDAHAVLDDAKKKLTPSAALERALGQISELQGDYEAAITHFNTAVAKDPKDPNSHFMLGVALRRVRKFDDAGAELDKVAAVDKDYPGLSLERGLLFEESGDVEKAIEQFNGALAKAPDDPDLQLRVGAAYVAIGRPDDALPMLRKVLDKRPTSAEAHHFIGRAMMLKGGQSEADALRYLKRAVEIDPNRAEFHVYLAWAANDAQPAQLELARDEIDRALALDNLNPEAYWQRGVLERMEGAVEDAVKDENKALSLRPSRYEAHATLAECLEDKNQDASAMTEWSKAIAGDQEGPEADPVKHPYWRYRYGKLLMDKGGPAAALVQLLPAVTTAEKISPKPGWLAPLEFLTAEALRKTGKKAEAVDHYKRFLEIAPVNSPDRLDAQQALAAIGPK
jgi:tetratricopeptide (TPR) repeat protein